MLVAGRPHHDLPLRLGRAERQRMFHLKSDLPVDDGVLRSLKEIAIRELRTRIPSIAELASRMHFEGDVHPLAAGSFHVVHCVQRGDERLAFRSTLPDLFFEDRTLMFDSWVRAWLGNGGCGLPVPETRSLGFMSGGEPFDFSVLAFADGAVLRDLGEPILDEEPGFLVSLGEALRLVHEVEGAGAGLLDGEARTAAPRGVHGAWVDYVDLNLLPHVQSCVDAGYIEPAVADRILRLFETMRPALTSRPLRLLHGDPGTHNICVDPNTKRVTGILDWEDALVGDPLYDVAMAISFQPERRHRRLLEGYGLHDPTIDDRRLIAVYFLRIALFKTTHRLRFAVADKPGRVPGHYRIQAGLDQLSRLV